MLKVSNLTKTYETPEGPAHAVQGVDFEVAEGEFYTLLGPSGCGKTTTLRCIAGLERPDGGEITIADVVVERPQDGIHRPAHSRDIGMVFQSYAIWPHLDVFNNVAYPLQVRKPRPSKRDIADQTMASLELVGMADLARRSATKLSGGQQQRVALARALVRHPKLLLLDEPLSNLDAKLREQMRIELEDMVSRVAITTIYVTHDQSEALSMSDRIAVMSEGLIVQEGPPKTVYEQPGDDFVAAFLGTANFLGARIAELDADGSGILELDGGGRLAMPLPNGSKTGETVRVVIRPENIEVLTEAPRDTTNTLEGEVERLVFQGGISECFVRVAATTVRSVVQQTLNAEPGNKVWLAVDAGRCVVFPK